MRDTSIPKVGRPVSVVGFGCWPLSGSGTWTGGDDATSIAAVRRAIELGVTFFDVAPVYGLGHAERVLGRVLAERRDDVVIASKCGLVWDDQSRVTNDLTAASLPGQIDASLRRLDTDHVDICQMHWPDPATPVEESMEALLALQTQGKIGHIGVSNFSIDETVRALAVGPVATYQGLMNLLQRNPDSYHGIPLEYRAYDEVLPFVAANDIAYLPYSPLLQGLLTDGYDPATITDDDVRRSNPVLFGAAADEYARAADRLRDLARELGHPLEQVAVNWLAAQPGMGPVIAGAQNPAQVESIAGVGSWQLTDDEVSIIDAVVSAASLADTTGGEAD